MSIERLKDLLCQSELTMSLWVYGTIKAYIRHVVKL
jgi:hypothetical protein